MKHEESFIDADDKVVRPCIDVKSIYTRWKGSCEALFESVLNTTVWIHLLVSQAFDEACEENKKGYENVFSTVDRVGEGKNAENKSFLHRCCLR